MCIDWYSTERVNLSCEGEPVKKFRSIKSKDCDNNILLNEIAE